MFNKKILYLLCIGIVGIVAVGLIVFEASHMPKNPIVENQTPHVNTNQQSNASTTTNVNAQIHTNSESQSQEKISLVFPLSGFTSRITKKPFGIYITPTTSPVQPERFTGYHTGADAETTAQEKDTNISVYSIADGTVAYTGYVNGYGGVVIIYYTINGEKLTALYGHLRLASVALKKNDAVTVSEQIGFLGTGYSNETNGERKHLHFSLLSGHVINFKGYTPTKAGLSSWIDPVVWLTTKKAVEPK